MPTRHVVLVEPAIACSPLYAISTWAPGFAECTRTHAHAWSVRTNCPIYQHGASLRRTCAISAVGEGAEIPGLKMEGRAWSKGAEGG